MARKKSKVSEPRIIRKIRPKDIMEGKLRPSGDDWGERELFFVYGKVKGVRYTEQGPYEPSWALKGQFEAERIEDGQRFMAAECFLPDPMHSHIVERFTTAQESEETLPIVEFAFKILLRQTNTVVGYEYVTIPLVQPASTEPLSDLRSKMLEKLEDTNEGVDGAQMNLGESA